MPKGCETGESSLKLESRKRSIQREGSVYMTGVQQQKKKRQADEVHSLKESRLEFDVVLLQPLPPVSLLLFDSLFLIWCHLDISFLQIPVRHIKPELHHRWLSSANFVPLVSRSAERAELSKKLSQNAGKYSLITKWHERLSI